MRHLGHVGQNEPALDILSQSDGEGVMIRTRLRGTQHIPETDHLLVEVRDLDPDGGLPGDRREDTDLIAADGVGNVVGQSRDLRNLDGIAEFDLITGDCGTSCVPGDPGIDTELLESGSELPHDPVGGFSPSLRTGSGCEQRFIRELIHDVTTEL